MPIVLRAAAVAFQLAAMLATTSIFAQAPAPPSAADAASPAPASAPPLRNSDGDTTGYRFHTLSAGVAWSLTLH